MIGLFMLVGDLLGGRQGMTIAFFFALIMNFGAYWFSDKMVLAMYRAQEVDQNSYPEYYSVVSELARKDNLPMPRVYVIPTATPNAFATGRNPHHAAVAATQGILQLLNRDELAGVMAHELSHVKHRDILISTLAATIAGAIGYLAMMARWSMIFGGYGRSSDDDRGGGNLIALLVTAIVMPIAASLIQLAISRSREYLADEGGAQLSGNPMALASALEKLERGAEAIPMDAAPATAHMFIVNPLTAGGIAALFRTHPSTEDRIARLQQMAARGVGMTSHGIIN